MDEPPAGHEKRARADVTPVGLPAHRLDAVSGPLMRFLRIESVGGIVLLVFVVATLVLSNTPLGGPLRAFWNLDAGLFFGQDSWGRPLKKWINDGLLTLFFFVAALELKREIVTGELRSIRIAALSIAAACGGMIVPAGLYLLLQGGEPGEAGWGTAMSTDTAFVVGALALLGSRVPLSLRAFLLSLVIIDDIGAILLIAFVYSEPLVLPPLAAALAGLAATALLGWLGMRSVLAFALIGAMTWLAFDASGIHATVAGVLFGLLVPARPAVSNGRLMAIFGTVRIFLPGLRATDTEASMTRLREVERAIHMNVPLTERLERALHPWVSFVIMPLFAVANADVVLADARLGDPVTMAVAAALLAGKPIGIIGFSAGAVALGLATRPHDLRWSLLSAGSLLAATGFTMSLLIADLALDGALLNAARLGVLLGSTVAALVGTACLALLLHRTPTTRAARAN